MINIEEKVEDVVKSRLNNLGIKYYCKTESVNSDIDTALKIFASKNGGDGGNYPDIKLFINNIPIMIEIKGAPFHLVCHHINMNMYDAEGKNNPLELSMSKGAVSRFAVNGAIHYCHAILTHTGYEYCIAIGIAGERMMVYKVDRECCKRFNDITDLSFLTNIEEALKSKNVKIYHCV